MNRRGFLGALVTAPLVAGAVVLAAKKKLSMLQMAEYKWMPLSHEFYVSAEEMSRKLSEAEKRLREALANDLYMTGPCAHYSGYDLLEIK